MRVAMTGAGGFLGLHLRAALLEAGASITGVPLGDRFDAPRATAAVEGADLVVHLAGVHRAPDDDVRDGNRMLAAQLDGALRDAGEPPAAIVYASSTQAGTASAYGIAKARAGETLAETASTIGARFAEHRLPNLFGEHGRPFSNAVTATFCHLLAAGEEPVVHEDRELTLLHAQDAADLLLGDADAAHRTHRETVAGLASRLRAIAARSEAGDVPDLADRLDRSLCATYRSHLLARRRTVSVGRSVDERGTFVEIARTHGGTGQTSCSTTAPGVTRGDHFHRRKLERFVVVAGSAVIRLRRIDADAVVEIPVDGDDPVAVDIPTLWRHSIENVGDDVLHTAFWTDEHFDADRPDTIADPVLR